ncbi:MAG: hypothetical protein H6707_21050 [Deltaproteobacteria bacterium]|nr:hypothetical protein [Deltaproteobacteria bacterium]
MRVFSAIFLAIGLALFSQPASAFKSKHTPLLRRDKQRAELRAVLVADRFTRFGKTKVVDGLPIRKAATRGYLELAETHAGVPKPTAFIHSLFGAGALQFERKGKHLQVNWKREADGQTLSLGKLCTTDKGYEVFIPGSQALRNAHASIGRRFLANLNSKELADEDVYAWTAYDKGSETVKVYRRKVTDRFGNVPDSYSGPGAAQLARNTWWSWLSEAIQPTKGMKQAADGDYHGIMALAGGLFSSGDNERKLSISWSNRVVDRNDGKIVLPEVARHKLLFDGKVVEHHLTFYDKATGNTYAQRRRQQSKFRKRERRRAGKVEGKNKGVDRISDDEKLVARDLLFFGKIFQGKNGVFRKMDSQRLNRRMWQESEFTPNERLARVFGRGAIELDKTVVDEGQNKSSRRVTWRHEDGKTVTEIGRLVTHNGRRHLVATPAAKQAVMTHVGIGILRFLKKEGRRYIDREVAKSEQYQSFTWESGRRERIPKSRTVVYVGGLGKQYSAHVLDGLDLFLDQSRNPLRHMHERMKEGKDANWNGPYNPITITFRDNAMPDVWREATMPSSMTVEHTITLYTSGYNQAIKHSYKLIDLEPAK